MAETDKTAEEVLDSLTGFDEMAIKQHFGSPISDLATDQSMLARALVFVLRRRDGKSDDDSRNDVLAMSLKEVLGYFSEESQESGKDEPSVEPKPEISLSSVS
jgi:hypothetical protein